MKSKSLICSLLACSMAISASANLQPHVVPVEDLVSDRMFNHIEPAYLDCTFISDGWRSNWFMGVSGGANVFVGSPLGCEDFFGRMMPALQLQVGKWFSPSVGNRIVYQGLRFKDSDIRTQGFGNFHLDLLWNPFACLYDNGTRPRFDAMPYVGVGLIHNNNLSTNPFAFSYGIQGRYRVTDRLHITAELGGTTTFKSFDGKGSATALGDNLLSMTAGVSWTIGNVGWKRVIDPKLYIDRNEQLMAYACSLRDRNRDLSSRHAHDLRVIGELKKILKIEGLLRKYAPHIAGIENMWTADCNPSSFPKNDYSGLNSLMARLRGYGFDNDDLSDLADAYRYDDGIATANDDANFSTNLANEGDMDGDGSVFAGETSLDLWESYVRSMSNGEEYIGAPIYFFFRLGTYDLTDQSQLINLDEIARLANKYGLTVRIIGAADSATGSESINNRLSNARASYIADQFRLLGVPSSRLQITSKGGIADHTPIEANRHTKVELFIQPK